MWHKASVDTSQTGDIRQGSKPKVASASDFFYLNEEDVYRCQPAKS